MAHTEEAPDHSDLAMHRIVCAVDATPASVELMRWAAGLCKKLGATVRLVHVVPGIDVRNTTQASTLVIAEVRDTYGQRKTKLAPGAALIPLAWFIS